MSSSSSRAAGGPIPPLHYCHQCSSEIRPLMTPHPVCPRCRSDFVEELEGAADSSETFGIGGDPATHTAQPVGLGGLLGTLFGNLTGSGASSAVPRSPTSTEGGSQYGQQPQQGRQSSSRSGAGTFGPFGFQWQMASATDVNGNVRTSVHRSSDRSGQEDTRPDDGMGGAGGGSDGRYFDFGPGNARSPGAATNGQEQQQYPAELNALRGIFGNIFGTPSEGSVPGVAGPDPLTSLFNGILGMAAPNGRMGDYVFGQQALDDIISQMMDQTQGSTAPPPASEDAISKLKRLRVGDRKAATLARNRECPTCLEVVIPSTPSASRSSSRRPSALDGTHVSNPHSDPSTSAPAPSDDDPPETAPSDTSDTLVFLPCKHTGHEDCIVPWLQRNGTCPICREALEPERVREHQRRQQEQQGQQAAQSAAAAAAAASQPRPQRTTQGEEETPHNPLTTAENFGTLADTDEESGSEDAEAEQDTQADTPHRRRQRIREAAERRRAAASASASATTERGRGGASSGGHWMPGGLTQVDDSLSRGVGGGTSNVHSADERQAAAAAAPRRHRNEEKSRGTTGGANDGDDPFDLD